MRPGDGFFSPPSSLHSFARLSSTSLGREGEEKETRGYERNEMERKEIFSLHIMLLGIYGYILMK